MDNELTKEQKQILISFAVESAEVFFETAEIMEYTILKELSAEENVRRLLEPVALCMATQCARVSRKIHPYADAMGFWVNDENPTTGGAAGEYTGRVYNDVIAGGFERFLEDPDNADKEIPLRGVTIMWDVNGVTLEEIKK